MKQTEITYPTPEYPRQLRLDTTTACPATCLSCHRFTTKRSGAMSLSMAEEIIKSINFSLVEIVPVNYGEFFAYREWASVLELIKKYLPNTAIVIPTNGVMLTEKMADYVCQIPNLRMINFSVNAFFEETYEAFMGLKASNLPHIESLIKRIKSLRSDVKIWVSMVHSPIYQTDKERDLFKDYWKVRADEVWAINAASANRGLETKITTVLPCRSIFSDIVVGFDGKLSSCCWDAGFTLELGNYTGDIHRDWHNEQLTNLRKLHNEHLRSKVPLCARCTYA